MSLEGGDDKDQRPGEEAADGYDGSGGAGAVGVPEIDAAAEVGHEEDGVDTEALVAAGLASEHEKFSAEGHLQGDGEPAQGMLSVVAVDDADGEWTEGYESCGEVEGPCRRRGKGGADDVEGAGYEGDDGQAAAIDGGFGWNGGPHEAEAGGYEG